ncbi:uncharacterized protein J3R85_000452 [Psidium guajava]|nr:uncharacterized protein J3R85_000452 [Psidium guajava]
MSPFHVILTLRSPPFGRSDSMSLFSNPDHSDERLQTCWAGEGR